MRTYGQVPVSLYQSTVSGMVFATGDGSTTAFPITVTSGYVTPTLVEANYAYRWVQVSTDANGYNDDVYLTTLVQCLKLNLGESPFYANYGIPQTQSVVTQVLPDYYTMQTQTQFSPYFASLIINRVPQSFPPTYTVTAITHSGAVLNPEIAQ